MTYRKTAAIETVYESDMWGSLIFIKCPNCAYEFSLVNFSGECSNCDVGITWNVVVEGEDKK